MKDDGPTLTPEILLNGYAQGIFPMSESRDDPELFWVDPRLRGILPIGGFRISRSLARAMRRPGLTVTFDQDFAGVIGGCADRAETWINAEIRSLYTQVFDLGHGHSVEVWRDGRLIGGSYGIALGAAFFGESMFSRETDASKIALAYLMDRLAIGGFILFDTQFLTPHLASLGGQEIPRATYRKLLKSALAVPADFNAMPRVPPPQDVIQRSIHTS